MNRTETRKRQWILLIRLLGFMPLIAIGKLIGDLGMAYFAVALESIILFRFLFVESIPDCMERMLRSRASKGQFKNADKVFIASFVYGTVVGVLGSFLFLFLAEPVCKALRVSEAALSLRILAFVLLFESIGAVLKGLFQGAGSAMPTVIAGVIKQLFGLLFAALFGHLMYGYGEKAAALLHNSNFAPMYGAAGASLGLLFSSFLSLAFLLLVYAGAGRRIRNKTREGMRLTEDGIEVFRFLLVTLFQTSGVRFVLRAGLLLGLPIYVKAQAAAPSGSSIAGFGAFYGKYLVLAGIVVTLAAMLSVAAESTVGNLMKKEEYKNARNYLTGGIQALVMFGGFFGMLTLVLAPGIMNLFFGGGAEATACTQQGFLVPVLLPLGLYFAHVLEEIGRRRTVLVTAAASFITFLLILLGSSKVTGGNVVSYVHGLTGLAVVLCLVNGFFVMKALKMLPDWLHVLVFPALASLVTGLCLLLLSKAIISLAGDLVMVLLGLVVGGICYLILLFVFRCITERDLSVMPGGKVLQRIGNPDTSFMIIA